MAPRKPGKLLSNVESKDVYFVRSVNDFNARVRRRESIRHLRPLKVSFKKINFWQLIV